MNYEDEQYLSRHVFNLWDRLLEICVSCKRATAAPPQWKALENALFPDVGLSVQSYHGISFSRLVIMVYHETFSLLDSVPFILKVILKIILRSTIGNSSRRHTQVSI